MDKRDQSEGSDPRNLFQEADRFIVRPTEERLESETRKVEQMLERLQAALSEEIRRAKLEILERTGEVETSVELIAREIARQ